jgi:hypothetical protein
MLAWRSIDVREELRFVFRADNLSHGKLLREVSRAQLPDNILKQDGTLNIPHFL